MSQIVWLIFDILAIATKETKIIKSEATVETEKQAEIVTGSVTGRETTETKAQVVQENTVVTEEAVQETVTNGGTFEGQFVHATGTTVSATSVTTKETKEVTQEATTVTVVRIVLTIISKFFALRKHNC